MTINHVDITGIGWITSTGLWRGKDIKTAAMLNAMLEAETNGQLPDIPLDGSYPSSRRMDKYSRLGMTAIALALQDARLDAWTEKRNIGIITSTEYGCLNTDFDYFDSVLTDDGIGASPGLFSYTLPSSFMGDVAIRFGLTGSSFAIHEKSAFALTALKLALNAIAFGDTDKMVCGVCHPEPPPAFKKINRIPAGALFIAIEKTPANGFSYGKVSLDNAGFITFNRERINDLQEFVRQCLAGL
jgi:3-oxoacyl-[acyl-carrier-protein] synthase II